MSNYIVLVKQVPDVAQITDNAFDPATGNLIRSRLASVINELDAQALAFAWRMKEISRDTAAGIICLTMGPPMAAEVLRYGLSRVADIGVLLTDRALGGADTPATANSLAHAIKKIRDEMLGGVTTIMWSVACSRWTATPPRCRRKSPRSWGPVVCPTPPRWSLSTAAFVSSTSLPAALRWWRLAVSRR